jgi:hypothetical protein
VVERDWAIVKLENFSLEMAALQFQPGIDYSAPPPDSGMYIWSIWSSLELLILVENGGDPVRFAGFVQSWGLFDFCKQVEQY